MKTNAVRLQIHALAYHLAKLPRTLASPDETERWSLTPPREKLIKIVAKAIALPRYSVFQIAEVAVPRELFRRILEMIDDRRPRPVARCWDGRRVPPLPPTGEVRPSCCRMAPYRDEWRASAAAAAASTRNGEH